MSIATNPTTATDGNPSSGVDLIVPWATWLRAGDQVRVEEGWVGLSEEERQHLIRTSPSEDFIVRWTAPILTYAEMKTYEQETAPHTFRILAGHPKYCTRSEPHPEHEHRYVYLGIAGIPTLGAVTCHGQGGDFQRRPQDR